MARLLASCHVTLRAPRVMASQQDRARLAMNGVAAAKSAGVGHVVVVSVSTADIVSTTFGRQFSELEAFVKQSGLAFTLLRLPLFTDNMWCVQAPCFSVPCLPHCSCNISVVGHNRPRCVVRATLLVFPQRRAVLCRAFSAQGSSRLDQGCQPVLLPVWR